MPPKSTSLPEPATLQDAEQYVGKRFWYAIADVSASQPSIRDGVAWSAALQHEHKAASQPQQQQHHVTSYCPYLMFHACRKWFKEVRQYFEGEITAVRKDNLQVRKDNLQLAAQCTCSACQAVRQ